jgi:hypothetical protein
MEAARFHLGVRGREPPGYRTLRVQFQPVVNAVLVPGHLEVTAGPLDDEERVFHGHVAADHILNGGNQARVRTMA